MSQGKKGREESRHSEKRLGMFVSRSLPLLYSLIPLTSHPNQQGAGLHLLHAILTQELFSLTVLITGKIYRWLNLKSVYPCKMCSVSIKQIQRMVNYVLRLPPPIYVSSEHSNGITNVFSFSKSKVSINRWKILTILPGFPRKHSLSKCLYATSLLGSVISGSRSEGMGKRGWE